MRLDTIKPVVDTKLKFVGNNKHHANNLTVGNVYEIYLYHNKDLFFIDDNGEKQFFDALIKSYWEEVQ